MEIRKEDVIDFALATAKGAMSNIPVAGGLFTEYINLGQEKIQNKRFLEWKQIVESRLEKLECSVEELSQNNLFYSCFQITSTSAMRAYQKEKRILLANALFNSVKIIDISEDKKLFFIGLLDKYVLAAIKLLNYYKTSHYHPEEFEKRSGMMTVTTYPGTELPIKRIIEDNVEFQNDPKYAQSLTSLLINDGLVISIDWNMPDHPAKTRDKKTTSLGDEFIRFICENDC